MHPVFIKALAWSLPYADHPAHHGQDGMRGAGCLCHPKNQTRPFVERSRCRLEFLSGGPQNCTLRRWTCLGTQPTPPVAVQAVLRFPERLDRHGQDGMQARDWLYHPKSQTHPFAEQSRCRLEFLSGDLQSCTLRRWTCPGMRPTPPAAACAGHPRFTDRLDPWVAGLGCYDDHQFVIESCKLGRQRKWPEKP